MCPIKTCYAAHVLQDTWPYGHIWRTVTCSGCHKLVDAQTPHPNQRGGNENSWLTICVTCDAYKIYPQKPEEIETLKKNKESNA